MSSALLSLDEQDAIPSSYFVTLDKPQGFPDEVIPQATPAYNPYAVGENWRVEGGGAAIGGAGIGSGPGGSRRRLLARLLRRPTAAIQLATYCSFHLPPRLALYR